MIPSETSPIGDPVGWPKRDCLCEHALHFRHSTGFSLHALPHEVRHFRVLLSLGPSHVILHAVLVAGDKERSDRRDDGESMEAALVLDAVYGLRGDVYTEKES